MLHLFSFTRDHVHRQTSITLMIFDESTLSEVVNTLNTHQSYLLCRLQRGYIMNFSNSEDFRATIAMCNEFSGISILPDKILYRFKQTSTDWRDTVEYPDGTHHIVWTEELLLTELGKVGIVFGSYI